MDSIECTYEQPTGCHKPPGGNQMITMPKYVIAKCVFCKTTQEVAWGKYGAESHECINCQAAAVYLHKI